jgi:hypothetical protein
VGESGIGSPLPEVDVVHGDLFFVYFSGKKLDKVPQSEISEL